MYSYAYDLMGNRTAVIKTKSKQMRPGRLWKAVNMFIMRVTTSVSYTYDADGNLVSETGRDGTDKVKLTYTYTYMVENRLEAVYDAQELLMAAAYDGECNRVFQLNYNLHTDEDWKGNSGNGNGSNKDNAGSGNSGNGNGSSTGNNGNDNREVGETGAFSAYNPNYDINQNNDGVKRATEDVLSGKVENPIGDAYFFFGRKKGYDLWVE